jgi:hypothetical protein
VLGQRLITLIFYLFQPGNIDFKLIPIKKRPGSTSLSPGLLIHIVLQPKPRTSSAYLNEYAPFDSAARQPRLPNNDWQKNGDEGIWLLKSN